MCFFTLSVHQVHFLFFMVSFMVLILQCLFCSKMQAILSSTQGHYITVWNKATTLSTITRKVHLHLIFALIVLLYQSSSIEELCYVTLFFLLQSFFLFHFLSQSVFNSCFSSFSFFLIVSLYKYGRRTK